MTQEAIKTRKQAKMLLVLISTTKTVDFFMSNDMKGVYIRHVFTLKVLRKHI